MKQAEYSVSICIQCVYNVCTTSIDYTFMLNTPRLHHQVASIDIEVLSQHKAVCHTSSEGWDPKTKTSLCDDDGARSKRTLVLC